MEQIVEWYALRKRFNKLNRWSGLLVAPMIKAIHFRQDLVENTIPSTSSVASGITTGLSNRIQLIEEHYTRSSGTSLVEDITEIEEIQWSWSSRWSSSRADSPDSQW